MPAESTDSPATPRAMRVMSTAAAKSPAARKSGLIGGLPTPGLVFGGASTTLGVVSVAVSDSSAARTRMARRLSVRCDEVPEEETRARLAIAGRAATARVARAAAVARVPAEATTARVGARTVTANMFIRSIHTRGSEVVCRLQCRASPIGSISQIWLVDWILLDEKEISYGDSVTFAPGK